jgi:pilus assembly protein CpaB
VTARRRRGLFLLSIALASGGLAASEVHDRERRATERLGPEVDVLAAAHDLRAGARIGRDALALRRVPARFVPPGALGSAAGVVGARLAVPVRAGGYLEAGLFAGTEDERDGGRIRRGERAVTVEVAGGAALTGLTPGARVDVLVSTEPGAGGGRTVMALAGAELLRVGEVAARPYADSDGAEAPSGGATVLATLRVTVRQAIYLTAADNFAAEIRLLSRPPGDHARAGGSVAGSQL